MTFWVISGAIAVAVAALLVGAMRAARLGDMTATKSDIAVYKDQLAEVDRDLARGVLTEAEADAVRVEVSRRLLEADKRGDELATEKQGHSGVGIVLIAVIVLAGTFAMYLNFGAPGYGDLPMQARLAALEDARADRPGQAQAEEAALGSLPPPPPAEPELLQLMEQLRAAVQANPNDVQGLTFLAQYEARLGNLSAAREAQARLIDAKGADATIADQMTLVDIMVFGAGGYVSPEAEAVVLQVLNSEPTSGAARYYLGLVEAQTGRADRAFQVWSQLLEQSPPNAPWVPVIRAEIRQVALAAGITNYELPPVSGLPALSQDQIDAAEDMSPMERAEMIQGMVGRLADRLAIEGGPPEDWARLISTLGVLGDQTRADAISREALQVFAGNASAISLIEDARTRAGLGE